MLFIIWHLSCYFMIVNVFNYDMIKHVGHILYMVYYRLNEIIILSFLKLCVNEFLGNDVLSHLNLTSNYIRHRFQHN